MPLPRRTASALTTLGVLASTVTAAVVSAAPAANATPAGDATGVLAFAQGQSLSGGGTVTTIAPDGTSHTWQPAGAKDDPNYGGNNSITSLLLTAGSAVPLAERGIFHRGDGPVGRALAVEEILVFGGPAVVPDAAVDDAVAVSGRTGWVRDTNRQNVALR